jgi:hypothetical protein
MQFILAALLLLLSSGSVHAVSFFPEELFRVPFGAEREAVGAQSANGQFSFPKDFTVDGAGRFYIYDSLKHRIARYSPRGKFEISFAYPSTARQVFAHADADQNLWLLITEPTRGLYYGVYDSRGKRLREGVFAQYNQFRLQVDDESTLHIILSSDRPGGHMATFIFHEPSLLMKKINVPVPPETHHEVRQKDRVFYVDAIPGAGDSTSPEYRITDQTKRDVGRIKGRVVYVTETGEIYTRTSDRELLVYDLAGSRIGRMQCGGLASSCSSLRFDSEGNLYQLDGIPNDKGEYTPEMSGVRLILWRRR